MGEIPDSTLMAYADGELDQELRSAVEELLVVDPAARERLAAFVATRREGLAPLFDQAMREPVPAAMRELVLTLPVGQPAEEGPSSTLALAGGGASLRAMLMGVFNPPTMAWAPIALALAVGVGVGFGLSQATINQPSGGVGLVSGAGIASGALRQALEGTPTNTVVVMKDATGETLSFRAVLSFLSKNDRYCRHYEIADRGGAEFAGLACQTGENNWQVEIYARTPARGVSRDGLSIPAGIPNAVESAVLELMPEGGGPLVGEPEEDLIRNGWRASK
jgi:anti-sigma factor RsiW